MSRLVCLVVFASLILAGCSSLSVPKEFQKKAESLGAEYYASVKPEEFRIRHSINSNNPLSIDKTKLNFTVKLIHNDVVLEDLQLKGGLLLESEQDFVVKDDEKRLGLNLEHIYVIKLNEAAIESFREMQSILVNKIKPLVEKGKSDKKKTTPKGNLSIGFGFIAKYEQEKKPTKFQTEIMFSRQDDYLTMATLR